MRFCPIVPVADLRSLEDLGYGHSGMCLVQEYYNNPEYREYYITHQFEYLILDNGAAENSQLPADQIVEAALDLKPTVVAMPDVIGDRRGTVALGLEFLDNYADRLHAAGIKIAALPQGQIHEDAVECMQELNSPLVDMWGLSKYLPDRARWAYEMARSVMKPAATTLMSKPIHLFGLRNPIEYILWREYEGQIWATDSAIPYTYAAKDHLLPYDFGDKGKIESFPDTEFFGREKMGLAVRTCFKRNLDTLQRLGVGR